MAATREPRRVRRARRRAAHHAHRARVAPTAADRFAAAADALTSAVRHSRRPAKTAAGAADDVTGHVRQVMALTVMGDAARRHYELKLAPDTRPGLHRLGIALMCLRGAIAHLDPDTADRLFEHYAAELTREAHEAHPQRADAHQGA